MADREFVAFNVTGALGCFGVRRIYRTSQRPLRRQVPGVCVFNRFSNYVASVVLTGSNRESGKPAPSSLGDHCEPTATGEISLKFWVKRVIQAVGPKPC